jgi:hypothetical protein
MLPQNGHGTLPYNKLEETAGGASFPSEKKSSGNL